MLQGRLRGDGRLQHHDAGPGMVWLGPAGIREDMFHLYGEVAGRLSTIASDTRDRTAGSGSGSRLGQRRRNSGRSGTRNSRGGACHNAATLKHSNPSCM